MKKITLFSLIFLVFFSCRKDVDEQVTSTTNFNPPVTNIGDFNPEVDAVNASLAGVVYDEAGQPVVGATVTLNDYNTGTLSKTTDARGSFIFRQVPMNAAGTFVIVEKLGYFNGSNRFFPKEDSKNYANIRLLLKSSIGSFSSGSGGEVSNAEGIKINFPANSIITSTGQLYDGNVNVAARWIDPTADGLAEIMPGNLVGVNRFNEEVAMATYGMMAVELTDDTGAELNIGNGQKAELTFPVPTELQDNAADEIPLWYFNEEYGLWQEEGTASLNGNNYVGQVSHFSFWNCDAPFPLVYISGTVVTENGVPVANAWVCVDFASGNGYGSCGMTDNDGYFAGKMPANEELIMTVSQYAQCFLSNATNIGPFDVDTDLGNIEVASPDLVEVTGTVLDCNGNALTNGWVTLTLGNQFSYYYLEDDNVISTSLFNCDGATELDVVGVNLDDLEESDVLTYPVAPVIDLGAIDACGNVLDEFLHFTVNGETRTFIIASAGDSLSASVFSAWEPGTNEQFTMELTVNTPGTYDGSVVGFIYSNVEFPTQGYLQQECGQLDCGMIEVIITEYGLVGEKIKGTFSGQGDFYDNMQQTVNLPYDGVFEIYRDY